MTKGSLIAVTGGAGFIGSHVVDRLMDGGHQVVVVDNLSTGKRSNLARWAGNPALQLVEADVSEGLFAPLAAVTRERGPVERIIHLAAQVSVINSIANPLVDVQVNYRGTVQVLEYARASGVKKLAFASSSAIYGDVEELPVDELARAHPLSPYGIDKLASEHMLHYYSAVHGIAATMLRFFNVYGPRQDPSSPYSGVISIFADRGRDGRDLTIFGDGEQTRDFVYVGDVARAVVSAALSDHGDRARLNIGTGAETSVNQLAGTVVALCGGASKIHHLPARAGEVLRSVAKVSRAADTLDFRAETSLADGLRETLRSVGAKI